MKLKRYSIVIGLALTLALTGCQSDTDKTVNEDVPSNEVVTEMNEASEEHGSHPEHETLDFSNGFESSQKALDLYMEEIVHKDFEIAYEALHEIDKKTFAVEDFVAYQKAYQSAKDIHGYAIHDQQIFNNFNFAGLKFDQIEFFDIDYAYVYAGKEPLSIEEDQDHGHDHDFDYTSHDHGHYIGTMSVAAVNQNERWFILQGLSEYELKDLTRKYTNQGISLNLEEKDSYVAGEAISVGNMIVSLNSMVKDGDQERYILDVTFMNAGFDPIDIKYFVNKFMLKDSNEASFISEKSEGEKALNGFIRSGSYIRGELIIPVDESVKANEVYFLMNTINPSKEPIRIAVNESVDSQIAGLYEQMKRKPSYKVGELAQMDISSFMVLGTTLETSTVVEGYDLLSIDVQVENTSEEKLNMNQVDLTVRTSDGMAVSIGDQLQRKTLEPGQEFSETIQALVKANSPAEITFYVKTQSPNNTVTVQLKNDHESN